MGVDPECIVNQSNLAAAYVDQSAKPAIIFRIAARNEKVGAPCFRHVGRVFDLAYHILPTTLSRDTDQPRRCDGSRTRNQ